MAGAVYKWDAKLSIPELELIIQMADFFDTSADVLPGYEVKDNCQQATAKRLQEYRRSKDWDGLAEAVPFLSEALLKLVSDLITTIMGTYT